MGDPQQRYIEITVKAAPTCLSPTLLHYGGQCYVEVDCYEQGDLSRVDTVSHRVL